MEKLPQFIKEFSKEESPEERQQTAQAIKAKRAEHFTEKQAQTERQTELRQATSERERALAERLESIRKLEKEITELSTSRLGQILNYFQLKKLQAEFAIGQKTYDELNQQQNAGIVEQQVISEKLGSEETPLAMQEAKAMLDNFYKNQKEKWANSDYTKEDITKNFSEEHLASLSLDDYALLLKRFPSEMVTHVTRQGIRDHVGHMYHTAGQGEYADGFMEMVEDGRLRSLLGIYLVENGKEEAILEFLKKYIDLKKCKNKEEAIRRLNRMTELNEGLEYADTAAVHLATEEVADGYYGSEKGNEIFVAFPSAHIASQYYFQGELKWGESERGSSHNDLWVWTNEQKGMNLNAGIIFIPEEVKVDRKTGSRYELDEGGKPTKNSEFMSAFKRFVDSPDFKDFADQIDKIPYDKLAEKLEPFRRKLAEEFGITDRRFQSAVLDLGSLKQLQFRLEQRAEGIKDASGTVDSEIENSLKREGILFTEAKDAVSSKEFWETYFSKDVSKRPSRIVYYKGSDPTAALNQWRLENGLDKKMEKDYMGFSEQRIDPDDQRAKAGLDRFRSLAEKVVEDYFAQKKNDLDENRIETGWQPNLLTDYDRTMAFMHAIEAPGWLEGQPQGLNIKGSLTYVMNWLKTAGDSEFGTTLYGWGGGDRYQVLRDGSVKFLAQFGTKKTLDQAKRLGFPID